MSNQNNSREIDFDASDMHSKPLTNYLFDKRPDSALLRGVKITEFNENRINPEPITVHEIEFFIGDSLNQTLLRNLTGQDDLSKVETLELKVNTSERSLGNFGEHLPNLKLLKLSHSFVPVVRDLGSCLQNLTVLHMCQCGVSDLDGLPMLISLKELYLAYNNICDISSCGLLEYLVVLDLEGNNIADFSQLSFLGLCSKLTSLTIEGNPLCSQPQEGHNGTSYNYRTLALREITHLKVLDGKPVFHRSCNIEKKMPKISPSKNRKEESSPNLSSLREDWNLLHDLIEDNSVNTTENQASRQIQTQRPLTSPALIHRPGSALKPGGIKLQRESSTSPEFDCNPNKSHLLHFSSRASTPKTCTSIESGIFSASSLDLPTADVSSGIVFCGNLARAMRFRKQASALTKLQPIMDSNISCELATFPKRKILFNQSEDDQSTLDADLEDMRNEINKSIAQIKSKKSPEVLKITHNKSDEDDDALSLSEGEGDDHDGVSSQRRTKTSQVHENEIDKKRESLENFADYFIEMSSKPVDLGSKRLRRHNDLDKYFEKNPFQNDDGDKTGMRNTRKTHSLKEGSCESKIDCNHPRKGISSPLKMCTSKRFSSPNFSKKDMAGLDPLTQTSGKCDDSLTKSKEKSQKMLPLLPSAYINTKLRASLEQASLKSSREKDTSTLHHNRVMKAASQYLRTGSIKN